MSIDLAKARALVARPGREPNMYRVVVEVTTVERRTIEVRAWDHETACETACDEIAEDESPLATCRALEVNPVEGETPETDETKH